MVPRNRLRMVYSPRDDEEDEDLEEGEDEE